MRYKLSEIDKVAYEILKNRKNNIFLLSGELGSGKTTLVKSITKLLGIPESIVNSPTFNIINVYQKDKYKIYHIDLYRIKNTSELIDIGFNDILIECETENNVFMFVEWPEIIKNFINDYNYIEIKVIDETQRELYF